MSFFPSTLYYASAAINAISIPGHIMFGIKHVDKAVDSIPPSPEHALGKATATTAWDMVNSMLAALALLNFQWAKRGGPRTLEERLIVWTSVLAGTLVGWRYFKVHAYAALGCLWVAPWMSAAAMLYQRASRP
ncbi:hypothetical protein M432DRAFT_669704 [Thermoascus aurantiacus ATCC 26904]